MRRSNPPPGRPAGGSYRPWTPRASAACWPRLARPMRRGAPACCRTSPGAWGTARPGAREGRPGVVACVEPGVDPWRAALGGPEKASWMLWIDMSDGASPPCRRLWLAWCNVTPPRPALRCQAIPIWSRRSLHSTFIDMVLHLKHMRIRTKKAYVPWARRFMLFHHQR